VAMHSRFRRTTLRTLKDTRIASVAGRFAIATWMHSHADDGTARKAFHGNSLFERFAGAFHLDDPHDRLVFLIAYERIQFVVQRNKVKLEVGGVRNHANDDPGEDAVHATVIHGVRMMRACEWSQKPNRQNHNEQCDDSMHIYTPQSRLTI